MSCSHVPRTQSASQGMPERILAAHILDIFFTFSPVRSLDNHALTDIYSNLPDLPVLVDKPHVRPKRFHDHRPVIFRTQCPHGEAISSSKIRRFSFFVLFSRIDVSIISHNLAQLSTHLFRKSFKTTSTDDDAFTSLLEWI